MYPVDAYELPRHEHRGQDRAGCGARDLSHEDDEYRDRG